jgi:diguanylate cyclase (GGDEF)-like protein
LLIDAAQVAPNNPPWALWALDNAQMGVLVLDTQGHLMYANQWICQRAGLVDSTWCGQLLTQVFPSLKDSYFEKALQRALSTGFASFLSNSLHPSPLPLFQAKSRRGADNLIKQSVHILPMGVVDTAQAGQRYVMVQISDMTQAVNRERLLKAQATVLHDQARVDALTGIGNRRYFDESLAQEYRTALREHTPLALLLVDLDHFKLYNDAYGHVKGDKALTLVADALRCACHRARDIAARYGGEELALILPETDLAGAGIVALELKKRIEDLNIQHLGNSPELHLTVSIGAAALPVKTVESPQGLIELADLALYRAKQTGRNRICFHDGHVVLSKVIAQS